MTLDEIATWIANHPLQGQRSKWMSDDAGDMAVRMIELMPDPTAMTHEEVNSLLRVVVSGGKLTTESEVTFKVDARSIQVHQKVYRTTPLHPGLFTETNMPIEEGLVERVMTDLARALAAIGYEGEPVLSVSPSKERISVHGFRSLQFTLKRPEANGVLYVKVRTSSTKYLTISLRHQVGYDRNVKIPLYGRARVAEAWVVDLDAEVVDVSSSPGPDGYTERRRAVRGDDVVIAVEGLDATLTVDEILG